MRWFWPERRIWRGRLVESRWSIFEGAVFCLPGYPSMAEQLQMGHIRLSYRRRVELIHVPLHPYRLADHLYHLRPVSLCSQSFQA